MGDYELYHAARKTHKYIKKIGNRYFYTQQEIQAYLEGKKPSDRIDLKKRTVDDGDGKMKDYGVDFRRKNKDYKDSVGVRVGNKKVEVYNTANSKYEKEDRWSTNRHGRLKSHYNEEGSTHTIDLADKKTYKKRRAEDEAREKKLSDFQESQGWRKSDSEVKAEKKQKRQQKVKKAVNSITKSNVKSQSWNTESSEQKKKKNRDDFYKKHSSKSINSLKKQSAKGKKVYEKLKGASV